ncbi:MAG: type II secretion system F family protein [Thermoguttaceae bacterium]|jgi:general secretion pathway protein F|nr:type II secretion system F family protein [Thermoguttaceae bacterium]
MPLNLDELAAINEELAALVRAGMPLEPALKRLAGDMPGRLGRRARELAKRLGRGEALDDVLADPKMGFPPMYVAILRAGQRSGRLAPALELFAETLARVRHTRRAVVGACVYPLIVIFVALQIGLFTASRILPSINQATRAFLGAPVAARDLWLPWGIAAAALALGTFLWWLRSRRASSLVPGDVGGTLAWLPWMWPVARWSRQAILVDLLRLFVDQGVPLPEALRSAARCTDDRRTMRAAVAAAEQIEAGNAMPGADASGQAALPPLLRWLLVSAQREGRLLPALEAASRRYHQRVVLAAERARILLPVLITMATAGMVVCMYAWFVFIPYTHLLHTLAAFAGE